MIVRRAVLPSLRKRVQNRTFHERIIKKLFIIISLAIIRCLATQYIEEIETKFPKRFTRKFFTIISRILIN